MSRAELRRDIRLHLNGTAVSVSDAPIHTTLLAWLRKRGLTATKEGCAEGDCGACTILLGKATGDGFDYHAVNACLVLLAQADGRSVITAEGLAKDHPAPTLLAEKHGTQCGFCSPGFTMSLAGLARTTQRDDETILDAISGNLCRCTGYRPIIEAARALPVIDPSASEAVEAAALLATTTGDLDYTSADGQRLYAPTALADALAFLAQYPKAWLWSGGSDLGLRITKRLERPEAVLSLGRIADLQGITETANGLRVGAAVPYGEALPALARLAPGLGALVQRLAAVQIRNIGTLGGNIGTASPIGDSLPPMIALGAILTLASAQGQRQVAMEDFITGYRQTVLQPGEVIVAIDFPRPTENAVLHCYKIAKRYDQDISTVSAAFLLTVEGGVITQARIAYGGVAAKPLRAMATEAALIAQPWSLATLRTAGLAVNSDISPMDDVRGSAHYRRTVAANLLERLWHESTDAPRLAEVS